jgi:NADH-quinone oxidoreductase subunit M
MMILLGAWDKYRWQAVFAVAGLVITAGYSLAMVRATMQGPLNPRWNSLVDARGLQKLPYLFLILILVAVGFFPSLLMPTIASGTRPIAERLQASSQIHLVQIESSRHGI